MGRGKHMAGLILLLTLSFPYKTCVRPSRRIRIFAVRSQAPSSSQQVYCSPAWPERQARKGPSGFCRTAIGRQWEGTGGRTHTFHTRLHPSRPSHRDGVIVPRELGVPWRKMYSPNPLGAGLSNADAGNTCASPSDPAFSMTMAIDLVRRVGYTGTRSTAEPAMVKIDDTGV